MAVEARRGCGFRKVNALYLCGDYIPTECDRLPLKLEACPVCGAGVHFTRSMTSINPYKLFGEHSTRDTDCIDTVRPCHVCDPPDATAYVMMVGVKHYPEPQDFAREALSMGVSKRIPFIPKNLELGKTILYLAHPRAVTVTIPPDEQDDTGPPRLLDAEKNGKALGIFLAFIPQRVEMPIWEKELTPKKRKELEKRGITPIPITDGDKDHK